MKSTPPPDDSAELESDETPREIPWAGLFYDPGMVAAERLDEELAKHWPDDLQRHRVPSPDIE